MRKRRRKMMQRYHLLFLLLKVICRFPFILIIIWLDFRWKHSNRCHLYLINFVGGIFNRNLIAHFYWSTATFQVLIQVVYWMQLQPLLEQSRQSTNLMNRYSSYYTLSLFKMVSFFIHLFISDHQYISKQRYLMQFQFYMAFLEWPNLLGLKSGSLFSIIIS